MPLLDPGMAEKIDMLQLLDDAITYRLDRLNLPCRRTAGAPSTVATKS